MTTTFTRNEASYSISEDALRQLQRTEAVGRLAAGVAHDFNNLLTVIIGCGKMLEGRHGGDPDSAPLLRDLLSAAEQGMMLTRQLLTFSRDRRSAPVLLELNDVVGKLNNILRRLVGEQVELQTKLGHNVGPILADPSDLQQVLLNLVVNARDAMPRGGVVLVETGQVTVTPTSREGRTGVPEGVYATVTVRDTGTGMTPEVMSKMFDPFFSTKEPGQGTGLGLCTVHDIIRRCNGYIRVASKPGVGSRFRVFFALAQGKTALPTAEEKKPADGRRSAGLVLVAEDSPSLRGLAVTILKRQGYEVLEASNGAEALSVADGHTGPIDLLFTDIRMPKMSGPELVTALSARRPGLRVVYTSGYPDSPPSPGRPVLLKPYWPDELLDAVGAAINAPSC